MACFFVYEYVCRIALVNQQSPSKLSIKLPTVLTMTFQPDFSPRIQRLLRQIERYDTIEAYSGSLVPWERIQHNCLSYGISVSMLARQMSVSPNAAWRLYKGISPITALMAHRLAFLFDGHFKNAAAWLELQTRYDLTSLQIPDNAMTLQHLISKRNWRTLNAQYSHGAPFLRLRAICNAGDISIRTLATVAGIPFTNLQRISHGKRKVTPSDAIRLAVTLEDDVDMAGRWLRMQRTEDMLKVKMAALGVRHYSDEY